MVVSERLVVIGGDAAGMSAASQVRRMRPEAGIVALERGPHTSYSACGMPYLIGGLVDDPRALVARSPSGFAKLHIDARVQHEVEEIDLAARLVRGRRRDEGTPFTEPFDQLLIATGTVPIRPPLPGSDASGIFGLGILEDGIRLRGVVDEQQPKRAVIVGGGYIGLEMAEALLARGLDVTVVEAARSVMGTLDPDMGELVGQALRDAGAHLYLEEPVTGFETSDGAVVGVVTVARTLPADLVVLGIGVRPNAALALAAGIPLGETGAIKVNDRMQTGVDGIWAAGDCVESFHLVSRRPVHFALGTIANKQGRIAGINLGGGYARFPGVLGSAVTKICDVEVARTGLQEREARAAGIEFVSARIDSRTRSGYYPGVGKITVKALAERGSGRLIGAQIVGAEGSGKRIDVFAAAIAAGMTAEEFSYLDLSYAPPFAPVWDPVLIAARKAAEAL
ncbi:MAG TPA: FAD-dependent oxidoreductase [Thermomicrobiaceae bacterium]|nr:FAD-dependent oxidoreductase [Thermomicrobiaceae bacterium]